MTSHKDHRLDQLGITSQDEADELQRELGIRFDRFTYHDRKVWNQQNSYLQAHARTRTVSDSADLAGVTISTAQAWKYLDTLGFTRRLEIADLRFSDRLQVMALDARKRTRRPSVPPNRPPACPHTRKILRQRTPLRHLEVRRAPLPLPPGRPTRTRRRPPNPPRHRQRRLPTPPTTTTHTPPDDDTPNRHAGEETTVSRFGPPNFKRTASRRHPSPRRGRLRPLRSLPHRGRHFLFRSLPRRGRDTERGVLPHNPICPKRPRPKTTTLPSTHDEFAHFNLSPSAPSAPSALPPRRIVTPSPHCVRHADAPRTTTTTPSK